MNQGMISGIIVRVENRSKDFPAAIVTLAGITTRPGSTDLPFFERVHVTGDVASKALAMNAGEAILFDDAELQQQIWNDSVTKDPRSQIITRGRSFVRLTNVQTKDVAGQASLIGAVNAFTIRGRLARDVVTKNTKAGKVSEGIVTVNLPVRRGGTETRPHYLKLEAWRESPLSGQKKGQLVMCEVLVKTEASVIEGQKRYFTLLETRTSAVFA